MKTKELRGLTREELFEKKNELSKELLNLRHQKIIRGLENPKRIRQIRRTIAAINTLIREEELGIKR
jgi:large subunit ribosomal protein L29